MKNVVLLAVLSLSLLSITGCTSESLTEETNKETCYEEINECETVLEFGEPEDGEIGRAEIAVYGRVTGLDELEEYEKNLKGE